MPEREPDLKDASSQTEPPPAQARPLNSVALQQARRNFTKSLQDLVEEMLRDQLGNLTLDLPKITLNWGPSISVDDLLRAESPVNTPPPDETASLIHFQDLEGLEFSLPEGTIPAVEAVGPLVDQTLEDCLELDQDEAFDEEDFPISL